MLLYMFYLWLFTVEIHVTLTSIIVVQYSVYLLWEYKICFITNSVIDYSIISCLAFPLLMSYSMSFGNCFLIKVPSRPCGFNT